LSVIETKNKVKIYNLVKKHFSLTNKSLKLFRHRLFFEPHFNEMYKRLANDKIPDDLRIRIPIKEKDTSFSLKNTDKGWIIFRNFLYEHLFDIYNLIEYSDFRKNKIKIKNQELKLFKYVKSEFIKKISSSFNDHGVYCNVRNHLSDTINSYYVTNIDKAEKFINEVFNLIGKNSIPKKNDLELVISLNFADWFLCSTGESWSTCLNLEGSGYWLGLPGLIGDKNLALVYITNGVKKERFDIKVDSIIARGWIYTGRRNKKEEIFYIGRTYPIEVDFKEIMKNIFQHEIFCNDYIENTRSRYYSENLLQELNGDTIITAEIYNDNIFKKVSKKNKTKFFTKGSYYHYTISNEGQGFKPLEIKGDFDIEDLEEYDLKLLINENTDLSSTYRQS
jgi:hypothetical protein